MTSGWHRKRLNTPAERARKADYNSREHKQRRAAAKRQVQAGNGHCWRCGRHIPPGAQFHLGHDDNDRTIYRGIECPPCNLKAAASKGAAKRNTSQRRRTATRAW